MNIRTIKFKLFAYFFLFFLSVFAAHAKAECAATLDTNLKLFIPEINLDNTIFQVVLQNVPASDGSLTWQVSDYSVKQQGKCGAESAFLVQNGNQMFAFLPKIILGTTTYQASFIVNSLPTGGLTLTLGDYRVGALWNGEGGAILDASQIELLSVTDSTLSYRQQFNFGAETEISLSLQNNVGQAVPKLTYSNLSEEGYTFDFGYAIPYKELPPELLPRLKTIKNLQQAKEADSLIVIVKGVFKSGGKKALENLVKSKFGETAAGILKTGGNILDVFNALDTSEEHLKLMAELDALDECARNPPALELISAADIEARIAAVENARLLIKLNTGNRFGMQFTSKFASLPVALKPFWAVIAGAKSYVEYAAKSNSAEELRVAQQFIPCNKGWVGSVLLQGAAAFGAPPFEVSTEVLFAENGNMGSQNGFVSHLIVDGTLNWKITSPYRYDDSGDICEVTHSPSSGKISLKLTDGFLNVNLLNKTWLGSGTMMSPLTGITVTNCCTRKGKTYCASLPGKTVPIELWWIPGDFKAPLLVSSDGTSISGNYQMDHFIWRWSFNRK